MNEYKRYKVELTIDLDGEWSGDDPNDWDWTALMDVGSGMELSDVVVNEIVPKD